MEKNEKNLFLISNTCFKTMCTNFTRQILIKQGIYIELIQPEHLNQLYELFELNRDYLRLYINDIDLLQTREDVSQRWGALRDNSLPLGI
jgi:hypothetical protein